jgi:hypothetical protein
MLSIIYGTNSTMLEKPWELCENVFDPVSVESPLVSLSMKALELNL